MENNGIRFFFLFVFVVDLCIVLSL